MENFDIAQDALKVSLGAEGSASKELDKWQNSIEAKILMMKSSWQSLSQTFMNTDFLKGSIEALTKLVDVLESLIDNFGILGTISLGVVGKGLFSYFKGAKEAKATLNDAVDAINNAKNATVNAENAETEATARNTVAKNNQTQANIANAESEIAETEATKKATEAENEETKANTTATVTENTEASANVNSASSESGEAAASTSSAAAETIENIENEKAVALEAEEAIANTAGAAAESKEGAASAASAATEAAENIENEKAIALEAAEGTANVAGAAKEAAEGMANLASQTSEATGAFSKLAGKGGLVVAGIAAVVAIVAVAYTQIKKAAEEASKLRQETIEASDGFLKSASTFEQAYIKYSGKINLTAEEEAELEAAIEGTNAAIEENVEALGNKSKELQNVINRSGDYVTSLEKIAEAEKKAAAEAAIKKRDEAKDELEYINKGLSAFDGSEVNVAFSLSDDEEVNNIAKEIGEEYYKTTPRGNGLYTSGFQLSADASADEVVKYYDMLVEYQKQLEESELKNTKAYENTTASIGKLTDAVGVYRDGIYEAVKAQYILSEDGGIPKTLEEYLKMREAILSNDDIKNLSFDAKKTIAGSLDSEYKQAFDLSEPIAQARSLIGIIDGYGDEQAGKMESFINMRTAVNDNECSVGEYISQLDDIEKMTKDWSDAEKEEFNLAFGIDTDAIKAQYDDVSQYLFRYAREKRSDETGTEYMGYLEDYQKKIDSFLNNLTAKELSSVYSIKAEIDWKNDSPEDILKKIEDQVKLTDALNFEANIEVDKTALETLNEILAESASAMGLSSDAIDSLNAKYKDLDGFNPDTLFEKTTNGIKVNREELEKLEKEYNNLTKSEVKEHLETLADKYNEVTAEIDKCSNAGERAQLLQERETYANKIEELAIYQSQLEGVTGAYQRWIDAQAGPEDYEGYESVATGREDVEDEINRGFIGNATKEYIDLLSGEDLQGGTIDDYADAWEKLDDKVTGAGYSIQDFFTVNDDGDITAKGIDRFFKSLQTDFEGSIAEFNKETGKWEYNFSRENLEKIQKEWGIGIEAIELLLEAAVSAGYDIDWDGILDGMDLDTSNFESLVSAAESAQTALNKLGVVEDVDFNFTATGVKEATSEIDKARTTYLDLITNKDGSINLQAEGAAEMRVILATLLVQKQQLEDSNIVINMDTSKLDESQQDIANAISAVQTFREKYKNLEIAVSTGEGIEEAKAELSTALGELQGLGDAGVDIAAQLILGEGADGATLQTKVNAAIDAVGSPDIKVGCKLDETNIGSLNSQLLANFTPEATVKITKIDESLVGEYTATEKTANGKVKWDNDTSLVVEYQKSVKKATGKVDWGNNTDKVKKNFSATGTVTWTSGNNVKVNVISEASGTANANGSTGGRAFARGNWGIDGNGVALGGELGQELVVRDGRFFTIGDSGAEFFRYRKNDIVFNAAQTASLFKYGGIKGANPRGKMLASGTAFAEGSYPSSGRAFAGNSYTSDWAQNRVTGGHYGDKPSSKKSKSSDSEPTEETLDWIEVKLQRIQRAIDKLDQKASNVYKSWSSRNSALKSEITEVRKEISAQQASYEKYMQAANAVGLDESWAKKVREGAIDIDTITDEVLKEKISDYQKWYLIMPIYLVINI